MQTLGLALRARGEEGLPLPNPLRRLADVGVHFYRSQLSLIAAAPGGGKSSVATHLCVNMIYDSGRPVPTLYFSADADKLTMAKVVTASILKVNQDRAEELLLADDRATVTALEGRTGHIWWSFATMPSLRDVAEEMDAYAYVHGEYPHLVVIDNLLDIEDAGEDLGRLSDVQVALKDLARRTASHMMVLTHVTGNFTDGSTPIPRSGIMYKIDKKAELILTLHLVQPGVMGIRVVKNRVGPASTSAAYGIDIGWVPEMGWFSE